MNGLAESMAAPAPQQQQGVPTVEEVIQLLLQGTTPEQLVQAGVPEQVIIQAIQVIEQQMMAQQSQTAGPQEAGLAQSAAGM